MTTVPSPTIPEPTLSQTPSPTKTATPTIAQATLTPLPTLEGEDLRIAVAELLANPMNCDVPCWWGAVPGITSIAEIKHTLAPYNFGIYEYEENGEVIHLRYDIENNEEHGGFEANIVYNFSSTILVGVTAYAPSISEFLSQHGQPDEVWLQAIGFWPPGNFLPVRLKMIYFDEGMAVGYVADGDIQEDVVIGCFANEETGSFRLISPDSATNYRDFSPVFEMDARYRTLEYATDLTTEDFMQRFSDPTQPQCVETSTELWQ
jgi:hypothetical protein